jgi:hypothetical protein
MAKRAQIEAIRPVLTEIDKDVEVVENAIDAVVSGADKATEVLESGLEKVADVVPEALDRSVHVTADVTRRGVRMFCNPKTMLLILGVSGAVAGATLGVVVYKWQKKRLEKEFEDRLDRELEEMRQFYIRRYKDGKFATPRTAAEKLIEEAADAHTKYSGDEPEEELQSEERTDVPVEKNQRRYDKVVTNAQAKEEIRDHPVTVEATQERNIFVDGKPLVEDDWDAEAEGARRDAGLPYVIAFEEFVENVDEYTQTSLTYYEGDDILADENDEMIQEVDPIVGSDNLTRFGHGSRDPNIVYIRNARLKADYEVGRSTGRFSEEVMGLRHSDSTPRLRKARWRDDE